MNISRPEEFAKVDDLDRLNDMLGPLSMRAGWNKAEPSLWPEPKTDFLAAHWEWKRARAALDAAGRLIDTELAERRNLFMVNPKEGNFYESVRSLVAAYQMILPGEKAKSHRHTPNALRLVLDTAPGCYTVVDGARVEMHNNDVLLTPGWAWHGHANEGDQAGYWIDYLDVPLVQLLGPMFLEPWPEGFQVPEPGADCSGLVFPWSETEKGLAAATPDSDGRKRFELGDPALKTVALAMEAVTAGVSTPPVKDTVSRIVTAISGRGETQIGGQVVSWSRGDTMTIPSWISHSHRAEEDAVLFEVSDRPVMDSLGFLRAASA